MWDTYIETQDAKHIQQDIGYIAPAVVRKTGIIAVIPW